MGTPRSSGFDINGLRGPVVLALVIFCQSALVPFAAAARRIDGKLEIRVVDAKTDKRLPVRMQIENSRGRPVRLKQAGLVAVGNSIYFEGQAVLGFRRGQYTFNLDAGPEYRTQSGHFEIDRHADDSKTIRMNRFANLGSEGWFAGDLAVGEIRKNAVDIVMRAEQLHVVPTVDWQPRGTPTEKTILLETPHEVSERRWYAPLAGTRLGTQNDCLLFNTPTTSDQPLQDANLVAISPLDQRLPALLAAGDLDAMHIIASPEVLGLKGLALRDRDTLRYPGNKGMGRFGEFVYFQMLEAGLRVAPCAGSGWPLGDDLAIGSHRVYAHCGEDWEEEFSYDRWWEAVSLGRVFVTNGPLLRPMVEGQPPGYVFRISGNQELELEIGLQLASREPVDYLEIIRNGQVEFEIRLEEFKERKGKLPKLRFTESGWFLLRVVAANADQYQRAMTAPYFVEKEGKPRVSRQAVQFFLDWVDDASDVATDDALETCRPFWEKRLSAITTD